MNTTMTDDGAPIVFDDIINDFFLYSNILIRGPIAVFGIGSNIVSLIIFIRLGLKDSMGIGLWTLSLTDFIVTSLGLAGTSLFVWQTFYPDTAVDPTSFGSITWGWWGDIAQLTSAWISAFLSLERCVCVVSPFKVKQIFTRKRSIAIMIIIYIINIAIHIPVFATMWLGWTKVKVQIGNETTMKDRMVLKFSENRPQIQLYIDIANGAVLPFPAQILILISVVWMIYGLRVSSRIRIMKPSQDTLDERFSKTAKLSEKETKLVKIVLLLAIILTICNIPRFIAVYAKQIFAEVSIGRQYQNLYNLLWNIATFAGIVNSSVNILVYISINRNYRAEFNKLFGCSEKELT